MAHLTRTTLAGTVAVLALLLAGCGGDEATEKDAAPTGAAAPVQSESPKEASPEPAPDQDNVASDLPDVCALLTPAEIETATGMAVDEGAAEPDRQTSASSLCQWDQTGGDSFVAVAIAPNSPMPYEEGEDEQLGTITAISVPGADEAYKVRTGITMGMMVDGKYVAVTFNGPYDGEQGGGTIAVAERVAANLQ